MTKYRTHFRCLACGATITSSLFFECSSIEDAVAKITELIETSLSNPLVKPRMHIASDGTAHVAYLDGIIASK